MNVADRQYTEAQGRLREAVGVAVAASLLTITLYRSIAIRASYAMQTAQTVSDGQWEAATNAVAYVRGHVPFVRPADLHAAFNGRLMTPEHPGAVYGLVFLWWALDQGRPEPEARAAAAGVTRGLAIGDLQAAQRIGLDEGARAAELTPERDVRYRKLAWPGACDWCKAVASGEGAGRFGTGYHEAESVPFHRDCKCDVMPVYADYLEQRREEGRFSEPLRWTAPSEEDALERWRAMVQEQQA